MTDTKKPRGDRKDYKLPIAINQGGVEKAAGETVQLFPDQIERIEAAAKARKEEA